MSEIDRDYDIKLRELNLREIELRNNRVLGIVKIVTTGVVVTLIPAILTHLVQKQELEIQTLKGEIEYLERFSDEVVERDDLTKRRNFVQYLATVAHSKDSRSRWSRYFEIVDKFAKEQEQIEEEISRKSIAAVAEEEMVIDLQRDLANAIESKSTDLGNIEAQLKAAEQRLTTLNTELQQKLEERDSLLQKTKISIVPSTKQQGYLELLKSADGPDRSDRVLAVKKLIGDYRANPAAIEESLNRLSPPLFDELGAPGRINILLFLRSTTRSTWTKKLIQRGKNLISLTRDRHEQGVARMESRTLDGLDQFEKYIDDTERLSFLFTKEN